MRITVFGVLWCIILIYIFIHNNPKYTIGITLFSMVFQVSSVVFIGDSGIGPQIFTSAAMIVWDQIHLWGKGKLVIKRRKRSIEEKISFLAILLFIGVILFSHHVNKYDYNMPAITYMMYFIQLVIFFLCYLSCCHAAENLSEKELQTIIVSLIIFVLVVGGIQILTTTNILPKNICLEMFIYNTKNSAIAYFSKYYFRFFSTFMEPSYCAGFLVGAFYYLITVKPLSRGRIWLSVAVLLAIILTFSSTAYGTFAIVGVAYLLFSKNKRALKILIPLGVAMLLFLAVSGKLMEILNDVIFKKMETGSGMTRVGWDKFALKQFQLSPWVGIGYKNTRGSAFIYSLLAQLGVFGAIAWFGINIPLLVYSIKKRTKKKMNYEFFHIAVIIAMMIAIPDIDFVGFWISMYICAAAMNVKNTVKVTSEESYSNA